jgi:ring-1,2-phenylacetyl-CoA epoxidase subunit PaaC
MDANETRLSGRAFAPGEQGRAGLLLPIADDELILGWRNSEWTGIAPFLEEDVAFSSIAQTEIGHARALYELVAEELGTDPDALALDRDWREYRSCPLVELRLVPDWAKTIARHLLYEAADSIRITLLKELDDPEVAGLAAKIEREEAYHRMHAEMWTERLIRSDAGRIRLEGAVRELWPYALGALDAEQRDEFARHIWTRLPFELPAPEPIGRGQHVPELAGLLLEMTEVRRLAPAGQW